MIVISIVSISVQIRLSYIFLLELHQNSETAIALSYPRENS